MASRKFAKVAATVETLEAAAQRVSRFDQNLTISSRRSAVRDQVQAMLDLFERMGINRLVTAKVGAWRKYLILADVIINYHGMQTKVKDGSEAHELAQLMLRAMEAVKTILQTNMPGLTGYCPTEGIIDGYWRFQ